MLKLPLHALNLSLAALAVGKFALIHQIARSEEERFIPIDKDE